MMSGGKLRAVPSPLLFGISLHENLVDVAPDQRNRLLLKILRRLSRHHLRLLLYVALRVLGGDDRRPYFRERVHVERQIVEVVLVVDNGAVRVSVELGEAAHIVPDFLVVGMEDVRAVLVHVDSAVLVSVDVPRNVAAPLDHEAFLAAGRK